MSSNHCIRRHFHRGEYVGTRIFHGNSARGHTRQVNAASQRQGGSRNAGQCAVAVPVTGGAVAAYASVAVDETEREDGRKEGK